jgi:methionyl-tRNA synthetase
LQISAALAVLSEPFLPFTTNKLGGILNFEALVIDLKWKDITHFDVLLPVDHQLNKTELLFSKIEDQQVEKQMEKLVENKRENEKEKADLAPQKELISFDDFSKLDIRTGTIVEAEKMPKAKKLLVLKVDIGLEKRTIVSGIAEHYAAEEILGKQVSVVINLKPIKLRGTLSEGMILMTEDKEGKLIFVNPDKETPNGIGIA